MKSKILFSAKKKKIIIKKKNKKTITNRSSAELAQRGLKVRDKP